MASATGTKYKQDMPPKGGYGPVDYSRKLFNRIKGKYILAGFFPFTGYAIWLINETRRYNRMHELENTEANVALEPLLFAEKDRMALKLFRQNYELEVELMKDYPGWEVGTMFGEPIFFDVKNRGLMPHGQELYAHTDTPYGEPKLKH